MFAESIENDDIIKLPRASFPGNVKVVNSTNELRQWLPLLLTSPVIGFDTETKPTFRKGKMNGVALLQLATNDIALIVRLQGTGIPQMLRDVLENDQIVKVGAAIRDDLKSLQKIRHFDPRGFVDLQILARAKGIESQSVRKLAAIVLNVRVSKGQQLSNWESDHLTDAQLDYAATDAWICREIYLKLIEN